ncbi:hypothetical protein BOTBODRAFT_61817 [Botryobasidium botryosum FD-172 SS1]|uniref:Uncharacterized protein n=1 Tax=Botryobasidium botryosum (strain FD-172 SS1) TaxID=930990 RepID=A0A067N9B5_BOTB1|nr:hypothetical protein BOTBODRAFT_61817 [Botryobasidium botryosum FD-172 SS1]
MPSFRTRNASYLRISANTVLPLYLYLDEKHTEWMSDAVFQAVLEDLRPLIGPKLRAEDVAASATSGPAAKKSSGVDVHRGLNYQFAYFFRKADPHALLIKHRDFIVAPVPRDSDNVARAPSPEASPLEAQPNTARRKGKGKAALNMRGAAFRSGRRAAPGRGKKRRRDARSDDEEEIEMLSAEDEDEDEDMSEDIEETERPVSTQARRSQRTNKVAPGAYHEIVDDEDADSTEIARAEPAESITAEASDLPPSNNPLFLVDEDEDVPLRIKDEVDEMELSHTLLRPNSPQLPPESPPFTPDDSEVQDLGNPINVDDEDDDVKLKPILRLTYSGFSIFGRCLCVVVEPWPASSAKARAESVIPPPRDTSRQLSIDPFLLHQDSTTPAPPPQAQAPLFRDVTPMPDARRSVTPAPLRGWDRPPVPLFSEAEAAEAEAEEFEEDEEESGGMMGFSQALNAAGGGGTLAGAGGDAEDEDDNAMMGDADEARGDV